MVAALLDKSRLELLDLSTRNRLLNTPRHNRHARTVEVADERSAEVYRLLVSEGRPLAFAPARERDPTAEPHSNPDLGDLPEPDDASVDERGVPSRHADTRLQTRLTSKALQRRLLDMFYDARTLIEEQGVNILYLAFGMLRWREADSSGVDRFAPLVLLPVALERQSAAERFRVRWNQEEAQANLSLAAKLKAEFGFVLPELPVSDDLDLDRYFEQVREAMTSKAAWEVSPNDIVLGFFSFAKFLMYRDLDPANWPVDASIAAHPLIAGLLRDGFPASERMIDEDESIDPHLPAQNLLHVVDADSSQTLAVEEARRGRNLVIQGPPGTGKSQTITNVISAAVADGKKVLFVAEKMAALDVVKRRLDAIGLGDMCLELHSHKANKRAVLAELDRTLKLGRPLGGDPAETSGKLQATRDRLNQHCIMLHAPLEPCGLTPFSILGELVRLRQDGVSPADFSLENPHQWTSDGYRERHLALGDLVARLEEIGAPSAHPWRGARLQAVLRLDLDRMAGELGGIGALLRGVNETASSLAEKLGQSQPGTLAAAACLTELGALVSAAPDFDVQAIAGDCWRSEFVKIAELVEAGASYSAARAELSSAFAEVAWTEDANALRKPLAAYGASWLRWLNGDYRRAQAALRGIMAAPPPNGLAERLRLLDALIAAQAAAAALAHDEALGSSAFGAQWRQERSDWSALRAIIEWLDAARRVDRADETRTAAARMVDRDTLRGLVASLAQDIQAIENRLRMLTTALELDFPEAFGCDDLASVPLVALAARLEEWLSRHEDLTKWIAFRVRADRMRGFGLGPLADRLCDGRMAPASAAAAFEMAYFEALMRVAATSCTELAGFDGVAHDRLVAQFRQFDRKRIEIAKLEVAHAHHAALPRGGAGIGPLGRLHDEIVKKRNHLPIRQLIKKSGPAVQAVKPVFMMSPLSVAQFLEPGAARFDLLVIDEASQVQPVDALGAIARCDQIVVVGDERQLPPTRFFARMTGDDAGDEDDDAPLAARDVESILGMCAAKGLPQRMLRWHYRSRHQSLIAVSNREFYENRLYIVPSPYMAEAGMGLLFHHLPNGVFDRGGTGVNRIEASAVAEAVIAHARSCPDQSLGVGCFSMRQKQAILDELERLRRAHPDTEGYFSGNPIEPFFVKNLENIQGDERDVVFISIGYARNASGYMAMRFGPLSADGGERRLNVLISRARRRCEVFSSITADDIDLERGRGRGVAALKLFLHFAQTGKLDVGVASDRPTGSEFEEQVARALRGEGYDVRTQVGLAGFFIDLAVIDSEKPGRYVLGVECDGASYHSARSARDRDRLRQAVLEDHGWIIHRIWSTDWFQRPGEQLRRTVQAIEAAKAELDARGDRGAFSHAQYAPIETFTVVRDDSGKIASAAVEAIPYREARISPPADLQPHQAPTALMARLVEQIVECEGPIHEAEVVQRIRQCWGLGRAGSRVQGAVRAALRFCEGEGRILRDGSFVGWPGRETKVRDRSDVESPTLRRPDMLPPSEIRAAVAALVSAHLGASFEDLPVETARLFGFQTTSPQLRSVVESEIEALCATRSLVRENGYLRLPAASAPEAPVAGVTRP